MLLLLLHGLQRRLQRLWRGGPAWRCCLLGWRVPEHECLEESAVVLRHAVEKRHKDAWRKLGGGVGDPVSGKVAQLENEE